MASGGGNREAQPAPARLSKAPITHDMVLADGMTASPHRHHKVSLWSQPPVRQPICFIIQGNWSGWRESNPRLQLGRLLLYH